MTATKYFINAFAVAGDVLVVPDDAQPSGSVSYAQGFPVDYELVQTDPSALDVPRDQFNQLINDITLNLQQYQQVGAPNFILASQNNSIAFPYAAYSIVTYDDGVNGPRTFMSKINSNTNLPTVTSAWWWLDNTSGAVVFDNATFDGAVNQGDAVYWDSGSSTFKQAIANGSTQQNVLGFADNTFKRVFSMGDFTFITGLTAGNVYYLSSSTPGQITNIQPDSNIVQVGIAKSSSEIFININKINSSSAIVAGTLISSNQVIPGASTQKVMFDTIVFDPFSFWNSISLRFDLSIPGFYRINNSIKLNAGTLTACNNQIYKNGSYLLNLDQDDFVGDFVVSGTAIIQSNGTDYIEIYSNTASNPVTVYGNTVAPGTNYFQIEYLGA